MTPPRIPSRQRSRYLLSVPIIPFHSPPPTCRYTHPARYNFRHVRLDSMFLFFFDMFSPSSITITSGTLPPLFPFLKSMTDRSRHQQSLSESRSDDVPAQSPSCLSLSINVGVLASVLSKMLRVSETEVSSYPCAISVFIG